MKVGLLTTGFPRSEGDHSAGFLLSLARGLVSQGHEVRVLAPEPGESRVPPRWPGIELRWLPYARPRALQRTFYGAGAPDNLRSAPSRWLGAASFTAALRASAPQALRDCDALVSSWCLPCGWAASELANGRDHLCICHETDLRWLARMPARRALARRIARGASAMWFLSDSHRRRFLDLAALREEEVRTHLGSMPIAPPLELGVSRDALRAEKGLDRFTLLFLGRLVPVKGVDRLLEAAARLRRPTQIRVAGDGPSRAELESLAQRLGVDAHFEGWVSGRRKERLLRACDALVAPSRAGDGLPTVLFEAKARSMPIIATRVGAIAARLNDAADTRLVAPDDPAALAEAIESLQDSSDPAQGWTRSVPLGGL